MSKRNESPSDRARRDDALPPCDQCKKRRITVSREPDGRWLCTSCALGPEPNATTSRANFPDSVASSSSSSSLSGSSPSFTASRSSSSSLSSSLCSPDGDGQSDARDEATELAFVDGLIEAHQRGEAEPLPVTLPPLPDDAPPHARRVASDFAYVLGLRLGAGNDKAVIYACRWVAPRVGASYRGVNSIGPSLERVGVLERVEDPDVHGRNGRRRPNTSLPVGFKPLSGQVANSSESRPVPLEAGPSTLQPWCRRDASFDPAVEARH